MSGGGNGISSCDDDGLLATRKRLRSCLCASNILVGVDDTITAAVAATSERAVTDRREYSRVVRRCTQYGDAIREPPSTGNKLLVLAVSLVVVGRLFALLVRCTPYSNKSDAIMTPSTRNCCVLLAVALASNVAVLVLRRARRSTGVGR